MKIQGWTFLIIGIFFGAATVVYWFWSQEPTGTTALAISVGLAFMVGYYLLYTARRTGEQPEDDKNANIEDHAGEIGFFSPYSWWPLWVCAAAALAFFGFVIGWWLFLIGAFATILALIGFVFEHYRGRYSH
ncbi:MAG: cytochrome c oxidase subunit 4 [Thermobispora bispora]|nr:cytochrome C oxidase subunit IV [Actinomycetales bacterium]MBX6168171.1 cytochrome c oxidase subunit 4 [Thermobispora bispora]